MSAAETPWRDAPSCPPPKGQRLQPTDDSLRTGTVKRRIEVIREAAALEEHALGEVWDYDERGRPWRGM